ncbi:MAG: MEDS domain-containing protein [candidate division NC10 bacterium]|nr:MEDS domain-containing protein [candidate division NC10 bacterium]
MKREEAEPSLALELARLRPGDHLCSIYRDFREQMEVVVPFLATGLAQGQRCLYLTDRTDTEEIVKALAAAGVPIEAALASRQFLILSSQESYLQDGYFDPERMTAALRQAEGDALRNGYSGLRVTGEMTWALRGSPGSERLIEYEAALNSFFPESHSLAICQYQEDRFSPELLLQVILTHPQVLLHGHLCTNSYYLPPSHFRELPREARLSTALYQKVRDDLLTRHRMDAEQDRARQALQALYQESERSRRALLSLLEDQERTAQALTLSQSRYQAVVEQSADGIYLVDVESKQIVEANQVFCRILGYSPEEVSSLSLYDLIAAEPKDIDERFSAIRSGRISSPYERIYRRKDGTAVPVEVSARSIFYGDQELVCAVVRDLTQKKALEAQLLRAQRMESIGLLAGGIAHDLNNMLCSILMNAELLQQVLSDVRHQKMLASLISNAQRGADIVKQILAFSRGTEGEFLTVSSRYLLKEMERFLQETFPKSIRIVTEIPKDIWFLSGDFTQLHQVLMNLCLNARDAMPHGGTLTLSAENMALDETYCAMNPEAQPGPYVLLSVSDTGSGIAPDLLERIFDPFFTTKEKDKGTGLGLSIALALVKSHQGFLRVYSEVGKGTRFHIYLPASLPPEKVQAEEEKAPMPTGSGELVLVVEDEASLREITQMTLEAHGYRTLTASEGTEAVALYAQHPEEIQLVVTDMAMPIMDGSRTIRALRRMNPSLKIIAVSGLEAERLVAEASEVAVQALLRKPFTAENLLRTMGEVLRGESAEGRGGRGQKAETEDQGS